MNDYVILIVAVVIIFGAVGIYSLFMKSKKRNLDNKTKELEAKEKKAVESLTELKIEKLKKENEELRRIDQLKYESKDLSEIERLKRENEELKRRNDYYESKNKILEDLDLKD